MRISVLGPLRVEGEQGEVGIPAAKERSLLAALALRAGSVVPASALVDAVWGERAPATARKTLQTYISNLRRVLGPDAIGTESPGYVLNAGVDDVDVLRFASLLRDGEEALRLGSPSDASNLLDQAIAMWRGDPFAGASSSSSLANEAARIGELFLAALEARVAADLASGRHAEVVGELRALAREHPFREQLWVHLMTALYRCGRQSEALAAFQRVRGRLREELGLEPGSALLRTEQAVLRHDPTLDWRPPVPVASVSSGRHPRAVAADGSHLDPRSESQLRYAECDDGVRIAYQVISDGPVEIIDALTLVIHASGDMTVALEAARYVAGHIPGATLVEVDSDDHLLWLSDSIGRITDEVESFISRAVPGATAERVLATVLVADIDPSPSPADDTFRAVIERFRGHPLGLPRHAAFDGPARAIRAATALLAQIGGAGSRIGVGLHSGECQVVGDELLGISLELAEGIATHGVPGEVRVSQTVRDLVVGSGIAFDDRGRRSFDGIPGDWSIYAVGSS